MKYLWQQAAEHEKSPTQHITITSHRCESLLKHPTDKPATSLIKEHFHEEKKSSSWRFLHYRQSADTSLSSLLFGFLGIFVSKLVINYLYTLEAVRKDVQISGISYILNVTLHA